MKIYVSTIFAFIFLFLCVCILNAFNVPIFSTFGIGGSALYCFIGSLVISISYLYFID